MCLVPDVAFGLLSGLVYRISTKFKLVIELFTTCKNL